MCGKVIDMKTAVVLKGVLGLAVIFSAASVASAIAVPRIPAVAAGSMISEGNKYLNELDYEQAIAQFELALEIEPKDAEAIQGIVEAAYNMSDRDKVEEYIRYYWETASEDDVFYEENEDTLKSVTRGARLLYETPLEYIAFLTELRDSMGEENFQELAMEAAAAPAAEGDYDTARELLRIVYDSTKNPEYLDALIKLYEICAEQAWKDNDYDRALDLLEEALKYAENDQRLLDELLKVAEDYIIVCTNSQQYAKAEEIISRIQGLREDDSLTGYAEDVAQMQEVDDKLQKLIEELNTAFDADDITAIETIMNSQEFGDCAGEIRRVLYSSSLQQSGMPEGRGTAIYIIDGTPYVYYGDYRDGKRQGSGRWYYSTGKGYLTKYTVNWENDLPNGEGKIDRYGTLTHYDENGDETGQSRTKDDVTFFCVNGIMDGAYISHSDVISDDSYSYDLTVNLVKGYAVPLEDGDYPAIIDQYHKYKTKIVAYDIVERFDEWWGYYESYVWRNYSIGSWTVAGFDNCVTGVSSGTEDLVLQ